MLPLFILCSSWQKTEHKGCIIHYNTSLHRRLVSDGLATAYRENEEIRKWSKYTITLALLSPKEVENAWELIKSNAPKNMRHFLRYIGDLWFGSPGVNMRNTYSLKLRTNNASECKEYLPSLCVFYS